VGFKNNKKTFFFVLNGMEFHDLVSVNWLKEHLSKVKVIDASWDLFHPEWKQDFCVKRIPGSVYFDIDEIADHSTDLPHMIPSSSQFEQAMDSLGISNEDYVVIYDTTTSYNASARAWWTLKLFGHSKVSILEGGLRAWEKGNGPLENSPPQEIENKSGYKSSFNPSMVTFFENVKEGKIQIVDTRSAGRFKGLDPEPRPNVRQGRIPNSKNIPYLDTLIPLNGGPETTFASKERIREMFKEQSIDLDKEIIVSCGSGVTASVVFFSIHRLGKECCLYDGSWTEYSKRETI